MIQRSKGVPLPGACDTFRATLSKTTSKVVLADEFQCLLRPWPHVAAEGIGCPTRRTSIHWPRICDAHDLPEDGVLKDDLGFDNVAGIVNGLADIESGEHA